MELMDGVDESWLDEAVTVVQPGSDEPVSPFCSVTLFELTGCLCLTLLLTSRLVQQRSGIVPGIWTGGERNTVCWQ